MISTHFYIHIHKQVLLIFLGKLKNINILSKNLLEL